VFAAVGVVFVCLFAAPGLAGAETFTVNSTADEVDASAGNEFCETAAGKCTLRAAIEEANFGAGEDAIGFEEGVFEGDSDSVIEPASALPTITTPLSLNGRVCETEAGVQGPCVEVDGVAGDPVLSIEGVGNVEIEALALTGAEAGLETAATPGLRLRGSWFGVGLDGAAAGSATGLRIGPGSDSSRIGGEGPGTGNLVANSDGTGLEIVGSSNVRVLGNAFGVTPTGAQAAPNDVNLAISSTVDAVATNNVVGTRVSPAAAATAGCDGGCNLISGSSLSGIDLTGLGGSGPPVGTTIVGNHIGLDAAGAASIPNGGPGVLVGPAPRTTIGGPRLGDENRIAGGASAVTADSAPYLVFRGNLIGSRAGAMGTAAAPQDGLLIDSTGLSLPAEEAQVLENQIGLDGGTGIRLNGLGGLISSNLLEGADTGIEVEEVGFENLIDSNLVEATGIGILVKGGFNSVFGNEIVGGQETGVRIEGTGPFGVSGNLIGGNSAAAENTIDGSTGNAIEIENREGSRNEVARNRGSGNGGLFVDLGPVDPKTELEGPNGGILPPPIAAISEGGAAGFADPGAVVRVFRKATPAPGEIASFLGQTIADEDGNWSLGFPTPLPIGTVIAATQTRESGTSELEIAAVPSPGERQAPPAADAQVDRKPPRTRVLRQPRRVLEGGVARFAFTANEPGSRFQCSLDGSRFRACKSPRKYRGLRPGKHVFRVRAIDPAGNVDRTPVRRRFEVLG
jgi:CSLREA domain-containing protein